MNYAEFIEVLRKLGVDPTLVVPPSPITQVYDDGVNEKIINSILSSMPPEKAEKAKVELEKLIKAKTVLSDLKKADITGKVRKKVWVRDPTKHGGGYWAYRWVSVDEPPEWQPSKGLLDEIEASLKKEFVKIRKRPEEPKRGVISIDGFEIMMQTFFENYITEGLLGKVEPEVFFTNTFEGLMKRKDVAHLDVIYPDGGKVRLTPDNLIEKLDKMGMWEVIKKELEVDTEEESSAEEKRKKD